MKSSKLDKLASKTLAWGLGNSLYSGRVFELRNDQVIWYLSHISHREKIEIFLRAVYSWMKQIIHSITKLLA